MRAWQYMSALGLACGLSLSAYGQGAPDFYKNKQMRLIVGHAVGNDYDVGARLLAKYLPKHILGQPSVYDYVKTDKQRQFMRFVFSSVEFGRYYVFPPDVPKERVDLLRRAIAAAANDPELMAEAEKMKLDMTYRPPHHLERLVANLYATPPSVVEAVKKLVPNLQ